MDDGRNLAHIGGDIIAEGLLIRHARGVNDGVHIEAQHGGHGADVLGQLVDQSLIRLRCVGVALRYPGADHAEVGRAEVGEHTGAAAEDTLYLVLALTGEAVVDELIDGQCTGAIHAHGALILHIADIHHTAMPVRTHADTAAQMTDDKVYLLVFLAQLLCRLSSHGLVVQRVELAQAAELGKAGVVRYLGHLVHADGIDKERGNAHHVAQLARQIRAQIGGMLAVGCGLHIGHDLVVDGVGAAGDGAVQSTPPAHGGEVAQLIARLGDGLQNGRLAVVRLVDDPGELIQLLCGVVDGDFEKLFLVLEHRDLGRGRAGVDD